ncbi:regulator [Streptomyces sp. AP-93]|uniref:ATP-binding protein n=1 Tax=Streptomyces sp. AP-93 TaxID=2929048 RepID=UPI001FAF26DF|nr:regulator [Streptomyces sp. AP-93]MCJ0872662.1 regulator [Streptomyces sp. AP-93]
MISYLPEAATPFIGREAETADLTAAIGAHRLTTMSGPAGAGKSRLALRTVSAMTGGDLVVCWAHLWPLDNDRLLVATISDAVGFSDHRARWPLEGLCQWLSDRRVLLVLDSCEHLTDSVRKVVADLLTVSPGLTVVATSREPLGVRGEHVITLGPLNEAEALSLLTGRAVAAGGFGTDRDEWSAAAEVCALLDGLPLALELAGAQLADTGAQELAARLRTGAGARTLRARGPVQPARHQSLWTAMGWSHELCDPVERLLWARLSVFRQSFDEGMVREVCAGGPLQDRDISRTLRSLARRSVLTQAGDLYRLLVPLRDYGRMWLRELGEDGVLADRHASGFSQLTVTAERDWPGPGQVAAYTRVERAHADLCAALDHLLATDPEQALELAGRLGFFWACTGHLHEARSYLERCLEAGGESGDAAGQATWALGVTLLLQGDHDGALILADTCRQVADRRGEHPQDVLRAGYLSGLVHLMSGNPHLAQQVAARALDDTTGEPAASQGRLFCRLIIVFALTSSGRLAEAEREADSLREECVALGEVWTRSYTEYQLSLVALMRGDAERAADRARVMVASKRQIGDSFGIALGLDLLAAAVAFQGQALQAARIYGTGLAHWRSVGHPQRGTPELAHVRAECEETIRKGLGEEHFAQTLRETGQQEPAVLLAHALGEGPTGPVT